ncbi:MAG: gamma-glutamyltransferase family protein [Chloroflexi bacterium]|nr:gamma-glutamyltransferase family protein [Chloroflexota bacterium]
MASPPSQPLHTTEFTAAASATEQQLQTPARGPVYGRHGVVASAYQLASLAGIDTLRAGGSAIDAALAVSAVIAAVQPYSSHLGGDAFVIVRTASGETIALNAGGRAPHAATPDRFPNGIPPRGGGAVAVPGLVDAWCALHARFASRPMAELLAPAIAIARDGFAVSRGLARAFRAARDLLAADPGCAQAFLQDGPPAPGSTLRQPDLARTLEAVASQGRDGLYAGETGRRIADCVREAGGLLAEDDLATDQAVWGEPLATRYRDWTVYEQPLPTQGFAVLEALNILECFSHGGDAIVSPDVVHRAAEAMRLALLDRNAHLGDPDVVDVPIARLLSKEYAAAQRERIGARAGERAAAPAGGGDTTSFAVADGAGNLVTFIQSIFALWGAAVLVPGTGVLLNNRLSGFSLDPASPNLLRPGRRTRHTLNTWLLEREGGPAYAGATPGADFQAQTNLQVITALVDWRLNPQAAIDAPKWALTARGGLALEGRFPDETARELERRGHRVERLSAWATALCRVQLAGRDAGGGLLAASDLRADGAALGW